MISEMDQENFAEVDRNNCALKLTQRRKKQGKSNQVLFIKSKQNMHLGKRRDGGGGGGGGGETQQGGKGQGKRVGVVRGGRVFHPDGEGHGRGKGEWVIPDWRVETRSDNQPSSVI